MIMFGPWDGPEITSLRFPKVVSVDAAIMEYARCGNVDGMKRLFSKGLASPHDVSSPNGYTLLHVRGDFPILDVSFLKFRH